eukprot:scaffold130176_cov30-Tisochrysis_lutea.AAC.2
MKERERARGRDSEGGREQDGGRAEPKGAREREQQRERGRDFSKFTCSHPGKDIVLCSGPNNKILEGVRYATSDSHHSGIALAVA